MIIITSIKIKSIWEKEKMSNIFSKESARARNHTNLVRTKSKSIQEYRYSFRPIMIRDLYSLKTFGSSFGIEMKGGQKS